MPLVPHYIAAREKHKSGWVQPLLEQGSFPDPPDQPIGLTIYPQAGEATIGRIYRHGDTHTKICERCRRRRRAENEDANNRRAGRKISLWTKANRARYMWTLTFADEVRTWDAALAELDRFLRRLRDQLGRVPMIVVPEPQPGGHAWHFHLATSIWLEWALIRRLWGQGHVWVGTGAKGRKRFRARMIARYLAKYIRKSLGDDELPAGFVGRSAGQHRYRCTRGFAPSVIRLRFDRLDTAQDAMLMLYGDPDLHAWTGWNGHAPFMNHWFSFPEACEHPPPSLP